MLLGFAITEHCNLRCPHCIRDDVPTVSSLPPSLHARTVDAARRIAGDALIVSLTGGEPLLHSEFATIVGLLGERGIPYRFVSNGWHTRRVLPALDAVPPSAVRLSLSGGTAATHDAERGRDSFRRVLLSVALLTSRAIPTALSLIVDRRSGHELGAAAALAESLGVHRLNVILPQPVPGSAERGSDLPAAEWYSVVREVAELDAQPGRLTRVSLDYGAPNEMVGTCDTLARQRVYVDARGRMCTCCQLSEYGFTPTDVVADLNVVSFDEALGRHHARLDELAILAATRGAADPLAAFPCLRCARGTGKLAWLAAHPTSVWAAAALA